MEGSSIQPIILAGAPASTADSRTILAASTVHLFARGCGEKMMAFLVFRARRDLNIVVEVGLVTGTIPAIIPIGSAILLHHKSHHLQELHRSVHYGIYCR